MSREYTISGVEVAFPFTAYPCQMAMMTKILQGLKRGQHCLLESPTGSGKSLALLCAALAWQEAEIERVEEHNRSIQADGQGEACDAAAYCGAEASSPAAEPATAGDAPHQAPTRHTPTSHPSDTGWGDDDLADFKTDVRHQRTASTACAGAEPAATSTDCPSPAPKTPSHQPATKFLKKPKIYFGTRTHKQIAQITQELRRTRYKHVKMTVLSSRAHSCVHPEVSISSNRDEKCRELRDPRSWEGSCSFFNQTNQRLRCHEQLELEGIVEAWSLEDLVGLGRRTGCCPYYAARNLRDNADIVFCPYNYLIEPSIRETLDIDLKNQVLILDEAHNIEDCAREAASNTFQQAHIRDAIHDLEKAGSASRATQAECRDMARMLSHISQWIDRHADQLTEYQEFDRGCKILTGTDMVAHFVTMSIGPEEFPGIARCYSQLMAEEMDTGEEVQQLSFQRLTPGTTTLLGGIVRELGFIYADDMRHRDDFRVALVKSMSRGEAPSAQGGWLSSKRGSMGPVWTRALHFWCLNPAVVFGAIGRAAHSVIVASGTLSPLSTFQSELGTKFPIQLEASHIIKPEQVYVATVSRGPRDGSMNATYRNSEQLSFQDELGETVLGVCATVPYGVLCFFPSYSMLDKMTKRWRLTGLWHRLEAHKPVMCEPRHSGEFEEMMVLYRHRVAADDTGALLLAVCRGKLSEGIDFSDDSARAVITVGIPFPSIKDVQVDLKRAYNNQHAAGRGLLTGHEWYSIQAYRALNQALGRCIRHRYDWGAILLVDDRFRRPRGTAGLSRWVRGMVQHPADWQHCVDGLRVFATGMRRWTQQRTVQLAAERATEASRLAADALVDLTNSPPSHHRPDTAAAAATPPMSPASPPAPPTAAAAAPRQFEYAAPPLGGSTAAGRKVVLVPLSSLSGDGGGAGAAGARPARQKIVTVDGVKMLHLTDESGTRVIPLLTRDGKPARVRQPAANNDVTEADDAAGPAETSGADAAQKRPLQEPVMVNGVQMLRLNDESGTRLIPVLTEDGKPAVGGSTGQQAAVTGGSTAPEPRPRTDSVSADGSEADSTASPELFGGDEATGSRSTAAISGGGKRPLFRSAENKTTPGVVRADSSSPELVRMILPSDGGRKKQQYNKRRKGVVFSSDEGDSP